MTVYDCRLNAARAHDPGDTPHPGTHRVWWVHQSTMRDLGPAGVARIARDGGTCQHGTSRITVPAGTLTILDAEGGTVEQAVQMVDAFRATAPGIRLGMYHGVAMGGQPNRNQCIDWRDTKHHRRADYLAHWRRIDPLYDRLDVLCFDAYCLGSRDFDRDLRFIQSQAAELRRRWPGKPVAPFVWGLHNAKGNPPLSNDEVRRYAAQLKRSKCDPVVWGQGSDALIEVLAS